jgi:hypothetical protein
MVVNVPLTKPGPAKAENMNKKARVETRANAASTKSCGLIMRRRSPAAENR